MVFLASFSRHRSLLTQIFSSLNRLSRTCCHVGEKIVHDSSAFFFVANEVFLFHNTFSSWKHLLILHYEWFPIYFNIQYLYKITKQHNFVSCPLKRGLSHLILVLTTIYTVIRCFLLPHHMGGKFCKTIFLLISSSSFRSLCLMLIINLLFIFIFFETSSLHIYYFHGIFRIFPLPRDSTSYVMSLFSIIAI